MIKVERLADADVDSVLKITVADEQVKFSGTVEDFLSDKSRSSHLHIIKFNIA
ncbi:MAG: hypothetical protein JJT87_21780 [Halomonas sp.]|nr:hypothetical protein [Halomonas sp.]MCC5904549.1 hypothetical protein [Halomonas sp.]